jgi:hypothetical protein
VKNAVEMAPGGMTYMPIFMNIGSGVQKLLCGILIPAHRQQGDLICLI